MELLTWLVCIALGIGINWPNRDIGRFFGTVRTSAFSTFCAASPMISFGAGWLSTLTGKRLAPVLMPATAIRLGFAILVVVALWLLTQWAWEARFRTNCPFAEMHFHEAMVLGLAQTTAALCVGLAMGLLHQSPLWVAANLGWFNLTFLAIPVSLGRLRLPVAVREGVMLCFNVVIIAIGLIR